MTGNGGRRARAGVLVALVGAAFALVAAVPAGTAGAQDGDQVTVPQDPSKITITVEPSEQQGECVDALFDPTLVQHPALRYSTLSDDDVFRLTVTADAPLCEPITATAAIYAMPDDPAQQWPQTLVETEDVVIGPAGTYVFEFAKDCDPVQFDVINGPTPQVIDITNPHGPLLFPLNVETALQHRGGPGCDTTTTTEPTTTTEATTTTETTQPEVLESTTTETTQPEVLASTTIAGPGDPGTQVGGAVQTGGSSASPRQLALTGVGSTTMLAVGLVLVAGGLGFVLLGRRERSAAEGS